MSFVDSNRAMIPSTPSVWAPTNQAAQRGTCGSSTAASAVSVWVLPTDEELVIARHTLALA